jgi:hypothetical protein
MKAEEYTLKYLYSNIVPVCACGCGKLTKYVRKSFKFNVYSRNHHPGNSTLGKKLNYTQEKLEEIKETRRQTCLDRYGVDSVMKVGLFSKKVFREGHNHPCWKGGTSSLVQMLRADYSLYKFWKRPILERDGFRCQKCDQSGALTVHHDKERMCDIIKFFIPEDKHELTYEEKKSIICDVVEYHVDNKVSGISLCKKCHKELHDSYNL